MRPEGGPNVDHCPCCKVCTNCPGFQKVLAVPDAGYVLYRHTTRVEDVNKKTGAIETTTDTVDDVFIIENTQGNPLGKIDVAPEIDRNQIKCPRCVHILKHAEKLLKNQDIGKQNVIGICEHCRKFGSTCVKCEEAVEKFQESKRAQKQGQAQRVKTWLSKIQKLIKVSLLDDRKSKNQAGRMNRGYSDIDLNNLLRQITKSDREPEIQDLFLHGIREFYSAKRGPLSERPYYPGVMKDKEIIFHEPSKPYDDKQRDYTRIHETSYETEKRYDDDSLLPSNITLTDDELEKDFIRQYGKSYKGHKKYSSPADSKWFKDEDFIPATGMRHEYEKKKDEAIRKQYQDHTKVGISPESSKYYGEKQKDIVGETDKSPADKRYEDEIKKAEVERKAKDKVLTDEKLYEDDRQGDFTLKNIIDHDDKKKKKLIIRGEKLPAKESEKRLERKTSPVTKIIYESPSRIRKYHSEESLLTGMTKMKDDVQKHETFDYYFPETIKGRKKVKRERIVSSSELIKDTLDRLKTKIEEEKRKREEAERLKEERRKRLEREKKEREERLLAQNQAKALETQSKVKGVSSGKNDVPKEKLIKDDKGKDKAIKDKVVTEKNKKETSEPKKKGKSEPVKLEKPEKKIKEETDKERKPKEGKVKEEKIKEIKGKEEKIKEEKGKDEKIKEEKPKEKELKIKDDHEEEKRKRDLDAQELKKKLAQDQEDKEKQMQELKLQREEAKKNKLEAQQKAKEAAENKKKAMQAEMPQQKFELTEIAIKRPSIYDLIQERNMPVVKAPPKDLKIPTALEFVRHMGKHGKKESSCDLCNDSDYEFDVQNLLWNKKAEIEKKDKIKEAVLGSNIYKYKTKFGEPEVKETHPPIVFQKDYSGSYGQGTTVSRAPAEGSRQKSVKPAKPEQDYGKGIVRYALSDRTFIEKGWTKLPTEKVVRKMNVYRMRPAHPEFDWFEHNKKRGLIEYDTGEKLAEFDENGRGRWYYRSGLLALDHYNAEEMNAQQRFVVYSSGEPDQRGRSRPRTVLATFDYLGNGVVFDHTGKIRLKYNQTEGVVLDRTLGPVSHWKWHTLNDPPVLQQVMIDTQMSHKDPDILKLGGPGDNKPRPDDEAMLAIEFDNFIKEKSAKLSQSFKPFQIKMKALKINEYFSLRVLDQANVMLIYRDGSTNIKLNIGMILDHKEIVDTDTAELGEVSSNLERLPARTDSLAELQSNVANAQRIERKRFERDRRINRPQPTVSVDRLTAAASKPLKVPIMPVDSTATVGVSRFACKCRKPSNCNVYYGTGLV